MQRGAQHAGDGFLPRQLTFRGSRLVYSWGIIALAVLASLLIILFQASVTRLRAVFFRIRPLRDGIQNYLVNRT